MRSILKSILYAIALLSYALTAKAQGTFVQNGKPVQVERWIESQFGKGKTPPFSFVYGGQPSAEVLKRCQHSLTRIPGTGENQIRYIANYTDSKTGLMVTCEVTGWTDFGTIEWVLHFENTGSHITPAISQVQTADISFRHQTGNSLVYYAEGSNASRADFAPRERLLKLTRWILSRPSLSRMTVAFVILSET